MPAAQPVAQAPGASGQLVGFPQFPSISPDGSTLVFSSAGDLWCVAASGGTAERLTSHPSEEARSAFSPDGALLAFESERDGPRNLYVMPVTAHTGGGVSAAGVIRRVTTSDKAETLSGFSADGKSLYFAASLEPTIFRGTHMYAAPVASSGPVVRLTDAFGASPHATTDGKVVFHRNRYDPTRPPYVGSANSDVFTLDPAKGTFRRLTADAHNDADAFALPDGSIVFVSSRAGENNVWRIRAGGNEGSAMPMTEFKAAAGQATIAHGVRDFNVAPGGWKGAFCVWDTLYTIDFKQDKPAAQAVALLANPDAGSLDFQRMNLSKQVADAVLSPDAKTVAVIARGQVFVRSTEKDRPTRRVTNNPFRARDLAWSPDGRVLYFASDDTGVAGIYAATVALTREDVGGEDKPKVEPEKIAEEKPTEPAKDAAADEKKADDKKTEPKKEKKPDWGKRWADSITFKVVPFSVNDQEQRNPMPSPDGKKLLLTRGRGDLVMLELDAAGNDPGAVPAIKSERTLFPGWNDADPLWVHDSRHIIYALEDVNYNSDIWLMDTGADVGSSEAKPINITRHPDTDRSPRLSADGKVLYFLSDRDADSNGDEDVYAVNLDKKLDGLRPYELADYYKDAAESVKKRKPLGAPAAADKSKGTEGKADAKSDDKPVDKKDDAAKDDKKEPAKPEPLVFDTDDAYLRIRRLSTGANAGTIQITPAADRVMYTTTVDGASQLVSVDYKGAEKKTVFAGGASSVSTSLSGDKVLFVSGGAGGGAGIPGEDRPRPSGGEAYLGKAAGGETEKLAIDAPVTIDIAAQQKQKFLEAARIMGNGFYHPTLKGLDWAALTKRYLELAVRTRTDPEFNRVFLNMLGELNGSHVGITGGRDTAGTGQALGYLGVDAIAAPGGYKIVRVIRGSPADRRSSKLNPGDVITAVNGKPVAADGDQVPATDLAAALAGTAGQETLLEVIRNQQTAGKEIPALSTTPPIANAFKGSKYLLITPYSAGTDTLDRYKDEVARNRAKVEEVSGGKLGYLHIRAMDMNSVRDFERDLFAAADGKLGLIIDVRDNGGGSTNDILLASLTAPRHAYTAARGVDPTKVAKDAYPRDRRLIYGYNREISVLCNQNSYSNAEIFSHAIKTIKRGKLVGTQTFGAVISTGAATLIDGTTIRTPFRGWYLPDGTDMENNGAMPDIVVQMTPEDEASGKDPQLEAAVKELLGRAKEP